MIWNDYFLWPSYKSESRLPGKMQFKTGIIDILRWQRTFRLYVHRQSEATLLVTALIAGNRCFHHHQRDHITVWFSQMLGNDDNLGPGWSEPTAEPPARASTSRSRISTTCANEQKTITTSELLWSNQQLDESSQIHWFEFLPIWHIFSLELSSVPV